MKAIKSPHNLLYDKFCKNEYISSLTSEYSGKYSHLEEGCIYALVKEINGLVILSFDHWKCRDDDYNKNILIKNLRVVANRVLSDEEKEVLPSAARILCEYVQGSNSRIAQCFNDAKLSDIDTSQYKKLAIELVKDSVLVISNTVWNGLSATAKYTDNEKSIDGNPKGNNKRSFVEMVTAGKGGAYEYSIHKK